MIKLIRAKKIDEKNRYNEGRISRIVMEEKIKPFLIFVIGLGSMGKRRLRHLQAIDSSFCIIGIDNRADRRKEAESLFGIKTLDYTSFKNEVSDKKSQAVAFISTSPLTHNQIINDCLKIDLHIFTELNLVSDGYKENISLANEKGLTLFLSSTLLYRKEIEKTKSIVNNKDGLAYQYHSGQYLASWHPHESINDFFVSDKRTNGIREIMAIDFPFLQEIFSEIKEVQVLTAKNSFLELNFPDTISLNVKHKNGILGSIMLGSITKGGVRDLSIFGKDLLYKLKWEEDMELAYKREILNFFECIKGKAKPKWNFEKDLKLIALMDKIEGIE
ncbi:MAG: Gfo/Idh/MocA family oxidoreductase [Clostridiales Family XIII bacterium]|jgi:predicted dehydrogenase|nr:Gfo/Idh/MocA family oxidoreductase [Clostridiales Family XIII bacterium]